MKTTSDPIVNIVDENGAGASVPRSAYEKVWAHRGYRLVSEVEAEQAAAEADEEGDETSGESGEVTPPAAAPVPTPGPRTGGNRQLGETGTGDSNQSATP